VKLHELQEAHGLRLGDKLTSKHIYFQRQKMKVALAIQAVASRSTATALRFCYEQGIPGLDEKDVIVTADFIDLHDKVFDILNSRSEKASRLKAALTPDNADQPKDVFNDLLSCYKDLSGSDGKSMLQGRRKCGFLGLLACVEAVKHLLNDMKEGRLSLDCLRCYKFSQDHLEIFFGTVRLRNGWSYNPTPRQFRTAFRCLLIHAGKNVLGSPAANCVAQDETGILAVTQCQSGLGQVEDDPEQTDPPEEEEIYLEKGATLNHHCTVKECQTCSATISYVAGFLCKSLQYIIKCDICFGSLRHSDEDPCAKRLR